jgi:hypothetical protein
MSLIDFRLLEETVWVLANEKEAMKPYISATHVTDQDGNPAGGQTRGIGIQISWQMGPLVQNGERREPNGAFVEGVIQAAMDRLAYYQETKFKCQDNADAIQHLVDALGCLQRRTRAREERGVEGTHAA